MDPNKVHAIVGWNASSGIKELRSVLGLANYYKKFIASYSTKATSLINFLKNNVKWVWSEASDKTFKSLKKAITSEPIVWLAILTCHLKFILMLLTM